MKVFISQPMKGKTTKEIIEERNRIKKKLEEELKCQIEIIDSFFDSHFARSPLYNLGESIKKMDDADLIYFIKGWQEARGCRIEHHCAIQYDLNWREEE